MLTIGFRKVAFYMYVSGNNLYRKVKKRQTIFTRSATANIVMTLRRLSGIGSSSNSSHALSSGIFQSAFSGYPLRWMQYPRPVPVACRSNTTTTWLNSLLTRRMLIYLVVKKLRCQQNVVSLAQPTDAYWGVTPVSTPLKDSSKFVLYSTVSWLSWVWLVLTRDST